MTDKDLAEALAHIAILREALEAIIDGPYVVVPLDDEPGLIDDACIVQNEAVKALAATPADAWKRVRAEVWEKAAKEVENLGARVIAKHLREWDAP